MKPTFLGIALSLAISGCASKTQASNWVDISSGNPKLDRFLLAVRDQDEDTVSKAASFKQISQWNPQYETASAYFAFIDDCALSEIKRAENHDYIFWARWKCNDGEFRQAFNTEYEKPKVMVSEMLVMGQDRRREKPSA